MVDAIISFGSHTTGILVGETLLKLGGFMTLQMRVHKKLVRNCSCGAKSSQVMSRQVASQVKPKAELGRTIHTRFRTVIPLPSALSAASGTRLAAAGSGSCRRRPAEPAISPAC